MDPVPQWDRRHFQANITAPDEDPAEHENSGIRCSGERFGTTPAQDDHDQPGAVHRRSETAASHHQILRTPGPLQQSASLDTVKG